MKSANRVLDKLKISELLQEWESSSLDLMKRHSQKSEVTIENFNPEFPVHGHWMVMATINSELFKMHFKLFFTTEKGVPFCNEIFNASVDQLTDVQLNDFAKELCNLVVGRIRFDFENCQIGCSTSLPMSLRSFDNLFFVQSVYAESYEHYWKFRLESSEMICCLSIDIIDTVGFNALDIKVTNGAKSGTFELI